MSSTALDDLGKLILRLNLGVLLLLHGISKLDSGVARIGNALAGHGLPPFIAYGAYLGEILAPMLLILGVYTRLGGLLALVNMLFAIGLVHKHQLFTLGQSGGWGLELQGFFLFSSLAVILLGAGSHSLGGRNGRWN
ncbi:DoxX family protein [Castellaniella sp. GW247-6E4]|uniref:DoxX family protein n=1 Tax=Castellaniella sp. GW247-6E4 TaxID=3140380 RepID=UPI003314FF5F